MTDDAPYVNFYEGYVEKAGTWDELTRLAKESWHIYHNFKTKGVVAAKCEFPILFFGNLRAYFGSPCKIVTVGKNPSVKEYNGLRFSTMHSTNIRSYLEGLNGYFQRDAYGWFTSYEHVLNEMKGSYHVPETFTPTRTNIAVHTDLCSPLATTKPWNEMMKTTKRQVRNRMIEMQLEGSKLWHALIRCLMPDVIIMSLRKDYVEKEIAPFKSWTRHTVTGKHGTKHVVMSHEFPLVEEKTILTFFGPSKQTPFGGISIPDRKKIGAMFWKIYSKKARKLESD